MTPQERLEILMESIETVVKENKNPTEEFKRAAESVWQDLALLLGSMSGEKVIVDGNK